VEDPNLDSPIEFGDPDSKTEDKLESFLIDSHHPEQVLRIGSKLHPHEKVLFKKFQSENWNVFAWIPTNMPKTILVLSVTSFRSRWTPS